MSFLLNGSNSAADSLLKFRFTLHPSISLMRAFATASTQFLPDDQFQTRPDFAYGAHFDINESKWQRELPDRILSDVRGNF